jgi:hypothetical protein
MLLGGMRRADMPRRPQEERVVVRHEVQRSVEVDLADEEGDAERDD